MQKINDLHPKLDRHKAALEGAFQRVMKSGWLILGPESQKFEEKFAEYLHLPYCVGVANGTDAIELSLKALDVKPGDKVATVANASMYTTLGVLTVGAVPHFMDVDIHTHNTTLDEVKKAVQAGVKVVVVTHLYGLATPEIQEIAAFCALHKVPLLEDCAQAHGAKIQGRCVGTFGDIASFSFYPTKNLGALGDGGAIATSHKALSEKVKLLRQYGWTEKYKVELSGARNSRLDELQAAFLLEILPFLDEDNEKRRYIAASYSEGIQHKNIIVPIQQKENYVAHLYVIRCKERESLKKHLKDNHILSDVHYPIPDHKQPVLSQDFSHIKLPHTEQLAQEILTLPCYPEMSEAEISHVVQSINSWQP